MKDAKNALIFSLLVGKEARLNKTRMTGVIRGEGGGKLNPCLETHLFLTTRFARG